MARWSYPEVVAHRGSSRQIAEHTAAAYQAAIDSGAEALECDVRLTADGHLVCVHDPRIDRTSSGRGRVSNQTLAKLQAHDFSSWHSTDPDREPQDVLTLDTLIEMALRAPQRIDLAIETKHPTRYGGYTEQVLVETLQRFGLLGGDRVRVMSFAALALRRMRDLAPQVPTVFLMDKVPLLQRFGALPFGARIAGPGVDLVRSDPAQIARWQAGGYAVHVWTVDRREDLALCMSAGVRAVISNTPDLVLGWRDELWHEHSGSSSTAASGVSGPPGDT